MYSKQQWRNGDTSTPISAARLSHLEDGVADSSSRVQHLDPRPVETIDVAALVEENRAGLTADHPYTDPTPEEVAAMKAAATAILLGNDPVVPDGAEVLHGWDDNARRAVTVLRSVPGNGEYWGLWAFPDRAHLSGIVEAPHPVFDSGSDDIAARVWAGSPAGTVLAVAGSHRTNPDGTNPRDVCKNTNSMWHKLTTFIAKPGLPELQLHGFADDNLPGVGTVVSPGSSPLSAGTVRLEAFIAAAGVPTARQWDGSATKLIGMLNAQGDAASLRGNPFAHLEVSKTTRDAPGALIQAIVGSGYLAGGHGALVTNDFPKPVGSTNSRGESPTAARADHTHRMVLNDPADGDVVSRQSGGWRSIPAATVVTAGGGYVKPVDGIPLTDLVQAVRDAVAALDTATYSATGGTIMKRTSTGAVSVADPTATSHAANKRYVDAAIAAALAPTTGTGA